MLYLMNSEINQRKLDTDSQDSYSSDNESDMELTTNLSEQNNNNEYSILMSPLLSKNLDNILGGIINIERGLSGKIDYLSSKIDNLSQKIDSIQEQIHFDKKNKEFSTIQNSVLYENNTYLNNQILELHKLLNSKNMSINSDVKQKIDDILTKKISFDNETYITGL